MPEAFEGYRDFMGLADRLISRMRERNRRPTSTAGDQVRAMRAKQAGIPYSPEVLRLAQNAEVSPEMAAQHRTANALRKPTSPPPNIGMRGMASEAASEVGGLTPGLDPITVSGNRRAPVSSPSPAMMASTSSPSPAPPSPSGTSPATMGSGMASSIFDELGPEGIEKVLGMGSLKQQMAQAQKLRNAPSPEGRYVSGGRLYVSGSPLEHLATGYGRFKGSQDVKQIQGKQLEGRKAIVELLRGTPQFEALASSTEGALPRAGVFNA